MTRKFLLNILLFSLALPTLASATTPSACPGDDDDPRSVICPGDDDDPKS